MLVCTVIASNNTCPICLSNKRNCMSLDCRHEFCKVCIERWLEKHNTCPLCRRVTDEENPDSDPDEISYQSADNIPDQTPTCTRYTVCRLICFYLVLFLLFVSIIMIGAYASQ